MLFSRCCCSRAAQQTLNLFGLVVALFTLVHLTTLYHQPASVPGSSSGRDGLPVARRQQRAEPPSGASPSRHAPARAPDSLLGVSTSAPPPPPPAAPVPPPGSSGCGQGHYDLIVGVLASPSARSLRSRDVIRQTWSRLPTNGMRVLIKFLLALDADGNVPAHLLEEAKLKGDIVFVATRDLYENLSEKVRLFFKWAVDLCAKDPAKATYILKTDDDSFIHLDRLTKKLTSFPRSAVFYGRMMKKMPGGKNKRGKWDPDNTMKLMTWPWYASGAGYVLTPDIAKLFAYPPLPFAFQKNEDRRMGVVLFGYNVTYIDAPEFYPWGHCKDDAIMIHYNRRASLVQRRYDRILKGKSICGEPFPADQICARERQGATAALECPPGQTFQRPILASFGGLLEDTDHARYPWCQEGMEGIEVNPQCNINVQDTVAKACMGKAKCSLRVDKSTFGKDPCPGKFKHLQVVVPCA